MGCGVPIGKSEVTTGEDAIAQLSLSIKLTIYRALARGSKIRNEMLAVDA